MAGHNANEARLFIPPSSDSQAAFDAFLDFQFPTANASEIEYINTTLYPPDFSGAQPYKTQNGRLSLLDADVYNLCWAVLLAATYAPRAWNYIFSVPPAYHAQDLAYTFFDGRNYQRDVNGTVARVLQEAVANFVVQGNPNGGGLPAFPAGTSKEEDVVRGGPVVGEGSQVPKLTVDGFPVVEESAVGRCGWWYETAFANSN